MRPLKKKWQIVLYGCAGMGVNMLNLIIASYLCSALLVGGFSKNVEYWTFENKDLVIAAVWSVFVLIAKVVDGIIDIPMASFTDNLKTRWGRRRPAILGGMVIMIIAYLAFLTPLSGGATIGKTVFYGVALCVFYSFYTLTMVTYYATFSEIVDNESDRLFLSNVKSVCDIVYFIFGYALLPILVNGHMNIRVVALLFLPLVLTMMIPMFLIRGDGHDANSAPAEKTKSVDLVKSVAYTFKDRSFILWMLVYSFMTMGSQLFLGGINEFFSTNDLSMSLVMIAAFAPVPFTLILFNKLTKEKGFGFSFGYVLLVFTVGMIGMFFIQAVTDPTVKLIAAMGASLIISFGIGALFSVAYSIPSQLAAEEEKRSGVSHSAMYFAVQGLFGGVSTGIATGLILVALKESKVSLFGLTVKTVTEGGEITYSEPSAIMLMTLISGLLCLVAFVLLRFLPKDIKYFGKKTAEAVESTDSAESEESVESTDSAESEESEESDEDTEIAYERVSEE
ncbi:MAG: MFS transporter [Clostridia bacterium]|nr:MFS transporter [Clostridia bacterium]